MLKIERRIIILLYVLSGSSYKSYLKKNGFKYVPDFLIPQIRPRILGEIKRNEILVGKVLGINTQNFERVKDEKKYIKAIKELKQIDDSKIYIEETNGLDKSILDLISQESGLAFCDGHNIRLFNIPHIIKSINGGLKRDRNFGDTLIISSKKEEILNIIQSLIDQFSFFTVHGVEDSQKEEVYEDIFNKTGVSIFQPSNIDKILKNYSTIINFSNNLKIDVNSIRNQALIIDFCQNKPLKLLENSKKNVILIEDIFLKVENYNSWINNFVSPSLFEALGEEKRIFSKIYTNNEFYNPSDFVRNSINRSGRI